LRLFKTFRLSKNNFNFVTKDTEIKSQLNYNKIKGRIFLVISIGFDKIVLIYFLFTFTII
jgi:hypothetical protein